MALMTMNVITIDGPAASGKSTVARLVAARLGCIYINTGDMYRTVTWQAFEHGIEPVENPAGVVALLPELNLHYRLNSAGQPELQLSGRLVPQDKIRAPTVTAAVSYVAKLPEVRQWMLTRQRETVALGLVVMEGRDIGTVIFPEAKYKFYMTASPEIRARRRLMQHGEILDGATVASVAAEIAARDLLDSTRAVAPMRPPPDAVMINTDPLSAEMVAEEICRRVEERNQQQH